MILVPSILPLTADDAARSIRRLARTTAPAEIRIDGMKDAGSWTLPASPRPPVIATCRRRSEGGMFDGTRRQATDILLRAAADGADYIDAEQSLGTVNLRKLFAAAGRRRIILSYHDPERTPGDLTAKFRKMASMKPAVVKIAVTARSFADTGRILGLFPEARKRRQRVSAIAMGEYGVYTRVLQGPLGGALTYGAYDSARPTAAGQLSFTEMKNLYRVPALDRRTRIFGLLGNPVAFSRGVHYHNEVFTRRKMNAVYVNFAADDAGDFMRTFGGRITGLSVTMPFKGDIRPYLDRLEGSSMLTGSVNTVLRKRGSLLGLNTDFHALLSLLTRRTRISGARMLVLGTGSTAATAAVAGIIAGAGVVIAGRDGRKAQRLAGRFGCGWIPLPEHPSARGEIIVNATPVGMIPEARSRSGGSIVAPSALRGCRLVCDFANPVSGETRLIADARRRGCAVVTGAQIFSAQAEMQSRLFLELA